MSLAHKLAFEEACHAVDELQHTPTKKNKVLINFISKKCLEFKTMNVNRGPRD